MDWKPGPLFEKESSLPSLMTLRLLEGVQGVVAVSGRQKKRSEGVVGVVVGETSLEKSSKERSGEKT